MANAEVKSAGSPIEISTEQISRIESDYRAAEPRNHSLLEEVVYILSEKLKARGLKVHAIEKRIKELSSVLEKCRRKSIGEFSELRDVVGARVICLFRSDMDQVGQLISENFDVIDVDDKLSIDNNPLGYISVHYTCEMPKRYQGPRYESTAGIVFEIQVRTLCMHCWAAVSHYLDYKGDWDVPAELKRALSALSGLFYVADSEFEQFYAARAESRKRAESVLDPINVSEINLDTMSAYLLDKFPNRRHIKSGGVSDLVQDIKQAGYTSIKEVDVDLQRAKDAFDQFERKHSKRGFADVGVVRLSLSLASEKMRKIRFNPNKQLRGEDPVLEFVPLVKPNS